MADPDSFPFRDQRGRFEKGNAGGPGGSRRRTETRRAIERAVPPEHLEVVIRKLVRTALEGDTKAAELVIKYSAGRPAVAPPEPEPLLLAIRDVNSLAACGEAIEEIVAAINQGKIIPQTAKVILDGIMARAQLLPSTNAPTAPSDGHAEERRIPSKVTRLQFMHFKRTGVLPADPCEASEIVERVKAGHDQPVEGAIDAPPPSLRDGFVHRQRPPAELMDELLDEAVYAPLPVRLLARGALIRLALWGADLTGDPLDEMPTPAFGTVGMALSDYPESLAQPPYVDQAQRLFARIESIRQRTPKDRHQHDEWFQRAWDAATCFEHTGELPDDALMSESVLVVHEMATLGRHKGGEDVRDLLQWFDEAARAEGEVRANALMQLQAMAKAARLITPTSMAG